MTKKKLVLNKHRKLWEPIIARLIDGLLREPPRTDGKGQRAKIQIKFHKDFKHVVKWPKFIWVPCDEEDFVIREWRNCTLLDHLHELTISPYCTNDIYKKRAKLLQSMEAMEKEIDSCFVDV